MLICVCTIDGLDLQWLLGNSLELKMAAVGLSISVQQAVVCEQSHSGANQLKIMCVMELK